MAGDGWVGPGRSAAGVSIPVAVTIFPSEQYQAPRSRAERAYPGLIYFNEVDRGGHFAAWDQPELFSENPPDRRIFAEPMLGIYMLVAAQIILFGRAFRRAPLGVISMLSGR